MPLRNSRWFIESLSAGEGHLPDPGKCPSPSRLLLRSTDIPELGRYAKGLSCPILSWAAAIPPSAIAPGMMDFRVPALGGDDGVPSLE